MATRQLPDDCVVSLVVLGELGLNGELRLVSGILPTSHAYSKSRLALYVPAHNAAEALRSTCTQMHASAPLKQV